MLRNTLEHIRRDQLIDEISELVHQQLVTSTLESQFRTRLENMVNDRLRNSGVDGQRTREFIRNINQTANVERNDFSNLGIYNNNRDAQLNDYVDSASAYQGHAAQRAATATNTREIRSLQSEIKELKNMMKLSFELQLDMQRSLKQEISALIAGTLVNDKKNNQRICQSSINAGRPANEGQCLICTESSIDAVLYQCGHMCVSIFFFF